MPEELNAVLEDPSEINDIEEKYDGEANFASEVNSTKETLLDQLKQNISS